MNVDYDFNFWTALQFAMNFALAVFVLLSNRKKAENDQLKALEAGLTANIKALETKLTADIKESRQSHEQRLERHSQKLARIESDLENAIGDDDIKAVHKRVDEILEKSSTMAGQMQMLVESMSEIRKIMMNRGNHV
jgi:predicted  nucleic acid-binding Zn-ribbon protein